MLFQIKSSLFAIIFVAIQAFITPAIAQISTIIATNSAEVNIADELAKLKQEKLAVDSNLKKQEAVCYKKFSVSDCLKEAKIEAQTALNKVKRREIELKDLQRSNKAEADLNKKANAVEKNSTSKGGEVSASESTTRTKTAKLAKTAKPTGAIKTEAEILAEKSANDKSRVDAAKSRLEKSNQKLAASQKKEQSRAYKNNQSAANTAAYNKKLVEAEAHKTALEKKNLERKNAKSASLPLPEHLPDSIPAAKKAP